MAHMRKSLLLSEKWDLSLDASGNLAITAGDYSTAQNVANECRLFTKDAYFAQERGIPYFLIALGHSPSPSVLRTRLRMAALQVEDVASVTHISLNAIDTERREIIGIINLKTTGGNNVTIEL